MESSFFLGSVSNSLSMRVALGDIFIVPARGPTGFVTSTDGRKTWNGVATTGLTSAIGVLAFDPQNPNHLYGGGAGSLFEITLAPEGQ
jgi:hypothetical protein